MKGRSQRLQSAADPPDDWVDGSWTVDCVCGVNYDDGDEMVTCDECGVWVHTRCSGYVDGDFTCDKCTSKNNINNNNNNNSCSNFRNDSEETEVAQLLVELPTKTMRMESGYGSNNGVVKRPFRLWTEIPMEERVHVQGVPGGDPELFNGLPSVFNPQLWKCTGYVPKKFNFQYREFPCWEEDEKVGDADKEDDNQNAVDKGAGVLFSLSKKNVLTTLRSRDEDDDYCRKASLKESKQWDTADGDFRRSHDGVKKERSLLRPVILQTGKRKKEDLGTSKDIGGKKKARTADKDVDTRKRNLHASKAVLAPTSDARKLEFFEDRGLKSFKADIQSVKNRNLRDMAPAEPVLDGDVAAENTIEACKKSLSTLELQPGATSSEFNAQTPALEGDVSGKRSCARVDVSSEDVPSLSEHDDAGSKPDSKRNSVVEKPDGSHAANVSKLVVEDTPTAGTQTKEKQVLSNTCGDMNVKTELDEDISKEALNIKSSPTVDVSCAEVPSDGNKCVGFLKDVKDLTNNLQSVVQKPQDSAQSAEAATECHINKDDEVLSSKCDCKQEQERSDGPVSREDTSVSNSNIESAEVLLRSSENELLGAPTGQEKTLVSSGNLVSSALSFVISKTSSSDNSKHMDLLAPQATKQQIPVDCPGNEKKEPPSSIVNDDGRRDILKKTLKDHSVSSSGSCSKASHSGRGSHTSVSRRTSLDSKDNADFAYSKSSSGQNNAVTPGPVESSGTLSNQNASHAQNKSAAAGLSQKGGKISHSSYQASSKVNNGPQVHPPAGSSSAAALSDEELALLLHQELNSSPRVPRVPRVRHAGSFPQLASQAATGMLIKRTSSSGVKDQHLVPRKKSKDGSKDSSRSSHEVDEEAKKADRVTSSSDKRRHDTIRGGDASRRETNGSATHLNSSRKNSGPVLATSTNSGPSSSTEVNDHKFLSAHSSPRNNSDEDTGTAGGQIYRTLPSLINEIMSKGRRMTYEELCNAVLPHWHNLRKHNGERYAYSSHSQAVLDCLRNRQEWAQLIDRGPKTNLSRKRRKIDAEESEDNEDGKHGTEKVESRSVDSQREEFPKGKRNARKRRRLVLKGRRIKDSRNRRKTDGFTDDDDDDGDGVYSNSSEDSIYSEEEIQGGGGSQGSKISSSSADTDDM